MNKVVVYFPGLKLYTETDRSLGGIYAQYWLIHRVARSTQLADLMSPVQVNSMKIIATRLASIFNYQDYVVDWYPTNVKMVSK